MEPRARRRSRRKNRSPRVHPWENGHVRMCGRASAREGVRDTFYRPLKRAPEVGRIDVPPPEGGGYGSHAGFAGGITPARCIACPERAKRVEGLVISTRCSSARIANSGNSIGMVRRRLNAFAACVVKDAVRESVGEAGVRTVAHGFTRGEMHEVGRIDVLRRRSAAPLMAAFVREGARNNPAPRSARGTRSISGLRPRRRPPQRAVPSIVAAAFAAAIIANPDFPWQSQGLDCSTRLRASATERETQHCARLFSRRPSA